MPLAGLDDILRRRRSEDPLPHQLLNGVRVGRALEIGVSLFPEGVCRQSPTKPCKTKVT